MREAVQSVERSIYREPSLGKNCVRETIQTPGVIIGYEVSSNRGHNGWYKTRASELSGSNWSSGLIYSGPREADSCLGRSEMVVEIESASIRGRAHLWDVLTFPGIDYGLKLYYVPRNSFTFDYLVD